MRSTKKIVLASTNKHKLKEFRHLFAAYPDLEIVSPAGLLRNPEKIGVVEVHNTYLENASAKARLVGQGTNYPALADDTGLEVEALNGRPGIKSARFAAGTGKDNVTLLLSELENVSNRNAQFVCVLAFYMEGLLLHAEGRMEGTIIEAPRGEGGFGYDAVFLPKNAQRTLAEMNMAEKNSISHRAHAVHELMLFIRSKGISIARP